MHLSTIAAFTGLCTAVLAAPSTQVKNLSDEDPMIVLKSLNDEAIHALKKAGNDGECTLENATRRKDWYERFPPKSSMMMYCDV